MNIFPNQSTHGLAVELYEKDIHFNESDPFLTDEQKSKKILSERYPFGNKLHDLAESNKEFITNLQTLAYTILNMEFEGGRDRDKLAEMYFETLSQLTSLGHQGSIIEMKNLSKIMEKARVKDFDEIEAAKISIIQGCLHNREDFDTILNGLFED